MTPADEDEDGRLVAYGKRRGVDKSAKFPDFQGEVADLDRTLAFADMNDTGNALRFEKREGPNFRFIRQRGWHGWDDSIWQGELGVEMALKATQRVAQAIWGEVKSLGKDHERRNFLIEHALRSGNLHQCRNMLAAALPNLSLSLDDCDAHPELVYLPNAVLRLFPSQGIVPREREHYVTKLGRARYDVQAGCPKWLKFFTQIFPDPLLQHFVQRAVGYSITGDMSEESFFLCLGMGRNGKGTFLRTIAHVLGSYAAVIPIELLLKKRGTKSGNEADPHLSQLPGCRFVITSEPGPMSHSTKASFRLSRGAIE
jgi:putative DNA primase/helicase